MLFWFVALVGLIRKDIHEKKNVWPDAFALFLQTAKNVRTCVSTDDGDGGIDESNDFRVDEMVLLIKSPCETQGSNWLSIGSFTGCQKKKTKQLKKKAKATQNKQNNYSIQTSKPTFINSSYKFAIKHKKN